MPIAAGVLDVAAMAAARDGFDERHARIHGHAAREKEAEVVSYRLRVRVEVPKFEPVSAAMPAEAPEVTVAGRRNVYFDGRTATDTMVLQRASLAPGATFMGPAIVEQFDATTLVPPGWRASVDRGGNLVLEREQDRDG